MLRLRKALLLFPGQLLLPDQDAEDSSTLLKSWVLSKGTRRTESWEMVDGTFGVWRLAFGVRLLCCARSLFCSLFYSFFCSFFCSFFYARSWALGLVKMKIKPLSRLNAQEHFLTVHISVRWTCCARLADSSLVRRADAMHETCQDENRLQ